MMSIFASNGAAPSRGSPKPSAGVSHGVERAVAHRLVLTWEDPMKLTKSVVECLPAPAPTAPVNANDSYGDHADASPPSAPTRISWARLLKRVFDIDLEHCPPVWWPLYDHRRHRRSPRDRQDPHASGLVRPTAAARAFDRIQQA